MLNLLKRDLISLEQTESIEDMIMESMNDDEIRDTFLDEVEMAMSEAESDPKVAKEVEDIPEFDEDELSPEEMEALENLSESVEFIPESELL